MAIIDMQTMRHINLLDRVSNVKTHNCFNYNNNIVFVVPEEFVSRAIGRNAENLRIMQNTLGRRARIVRAPNGIADAENFLKELIAPGDFKSLEIIDGEMLITAGSMQNKAGLLGREKKRLDELKIIVSSMFNMHVKVI